MTQKHPIIAVTGASGSGTTTARHAFEQLFAKKHIKPAIVEGDGFHLFTRKEMDLRVQDALKNKSSFSHFSPQANLLTKLEQLFSQYGEDGTGEYRRYIHSDSEPNIAEAPPGTFTPWSVLSKDTDVLFYEGLHGGFVNKRCDIAKHVDLLIGMTPTINLEWIQKVNRDIKRRGHPPKVVRANIERRLHDYIDHIVPQFSRTHINFQRVPMVDTSNPFALNRIPSPDETMVVIHFQRVTEPNFEQYLSLIEGARLSAKNTLVIPGQHMAFAIEVILGPLVEKLITSSKEVKQHAHQTELG